MSLLLCMINIRITTNATIYCTAISMIDKRISSALKQFMLKQTKKNPKNKVQLKKHSFIQAGNFINLPRMSDFSKFRFKLLKADADILKKYIQTDFKNDPVTAS